MGQLRSQLPCALCLNRPSPKNKERKREMKKSVFVLIALLVASLAAFVGCFGSSKQTLHLYCWADYISPELIEAFEKENNCRVVYDTFDSNEALLAKLQAGATGYDIIFPATMSLIPLPPAASS